MRGKGKNKWKIRDRKRITPAYAGKSSICVKVVSPTRDHPRLCGEKAFGWLTTAAGKGSPPPMRGKESLKDNPKLIIRITPAYAGKRMSTMYELTAD